MGKVLRCPLAYRSDGACAGTHAPRAPKRRVSPGFAVPRRFSAYLGGKTPGYAVPRQEMAGIRRRPCAAYLGLGQCTLFVFAVRRRKIGWCELQTMQGRRGSTAKLVLACAGADGVGKKHEARRAFPRPHSSTDTPGAETSFLHVRRGTWSA
jgi:hypothetical protein